MKIMKYFGSRNTALRRAAPAAIAVAVALATAQAQPSHEEGLAPGGINPLPFIHSFSNAPSGILRAVCGGYAGGPFQVVVSTNLAGVVWRPVGPKFYTNDFVVDLTNAAPNCFYRITGPNPPYAGAISCANCHGNDGVAQDWVHDDWRLTKHAAAFDNLPAFAQSNPSCLPCHTVGYGYPNGYLTNGNPYLRGVQCENCHGPGGTHSFNRSNPAKFPAVVLGAQVCGSCHTGSHHPTYDEWEQSAHAEVNEDFAAPSNGFISTNLTAGFSRQMSCGPCHSGATRMAMLRNYEKGSTYLDLPSGAEAMAAGVTCAVCHDPHADVQAAQLRNPMRSTNYYTLFTGSVTVTNYTTNTSGQVSSEIKYKNNVFNAQYDPNVQVCAQCHNSRGARWDGRSKTWNMASNSMVLGTSQSFSRPPHHSPQYNLLVGIVQDDYFNTNSLGVATNFLQRHGTSASGSSGVYNTNQCATCHVVGYAVNANTNVTGHTFALNTRGCTISGCHGSLPDYEAVMEETEESLAHAVDLLNQWSLTFGTHLFGPVNAARYKENGWEYTTRGSLSTATNAGPSSADQLKIPNAIKQARFNLYMVSYDGSGGIHNPRYATALINDAVSKTTGEFTLANFRASPTTGFAPLTVVCTNLGAGVTGYNWDFGDGNTSNDAVATNVYTRPGIYTVTLTATGAGGSQQLVRKDYIHVVQRPSVAFTADSLTGPAPLTVNFQNTSANAVDVTAWRWTVATGVNISSQNATYTYTNPGNYNVSLRASTPAGNVTTTSNAFIRVLAP
jgi:PKD repeat protein